MNAAGLCLRGACHRSAVSRAYYATFAAVTAALLDCGLRPPSDRQTWGHAGLPELIGAHLRQRLGFARMKWLRHTVRAMYVERVAADYLAGKTIEEVVANRCVANSAIACRQLMKNGG